MNQTPSWNLNYFVYAFFIFVAMVFSRLIPHPWNFTAIGAGSFFLPFILSRSGVAQLDFFKHLTPGLKSLMTVLIAVLFVLAGLIVSDLALGFYEGVLFVYSASFLCVILGTAFQDQLQNSFEGHDVMRSSLKVGSAQLFGSFFFFILTNFALWFHSGMYAKTTAGLVECYVMALPFLKWQFAGDLFYLSLFAFGFKLVQYKSQEDKQTIR